MNFFANQDAARRQTGRLILLFILSVVAIVAACDIAVVVILYAFGDSSAKPTPGVDPGSFLDTVIAYAILSSVPLAIIVIGTLREIMGVAGGGSVVARDLGARQISASTPDASERRLINVVEELAIACGTTAPQVFVMDGEAGINAFAAGFSPNEAAITVTRGALETLNRDELQGVIAHEFSHILNGDMRLNMRLMGVLGGLLALSIVGGKVAEMGAGGKDSKSDGSLPFALLGVALIAIGFIGVFFGRLIKSGVSRQREFLADASSVQFTRNPDGIGGALARIAGAAKGALVTHPHAEKASHMFFGEAIAAKFSDFGRKTSLKVFGPAVTTKFSDLMASHPPVNERLHKIYGRPISASDIVARAAPPEPVRQAEAASSFAGASASGGSAAARRAPDDAAKTEVPAHAAAVAGAVGTVSTGHMEYAVSLLDSLPQEVREQSRTAQGAKFAMYGLVLALGGPVRTAQAQILGAAGTDADTAFAVAANLQALGEKTRLPLISLAIPALKSLPEPERLEFLALLQKLIEADRRVTLEEFVLSTLLTSALGAGAGRAVPIKFRTIEPLAEDARLVLSLLAHAGRGDSAKAFSQGVRELGLAPAPTLIEVRSVNVGSVTQALGRLNQLAPLQKARLIKALVQATLADGKLVLAEAELLRAVCATLDSPLPPFIEGDGSPPRRISL